MKKLAGLWRDDTRSENETEEQKEMQREREREGRWVMKLRVSCEMGWLEVMSMSTFR
jgi:hypothetical protein